MYLAVMLSFWQIGSINAGDAVPALAGKEVAKRMAQMQEAQALVAEGASLFDKGDNAGAMKLCRQAFENLPDAPLIAPLKNAARDGYSRAANAEARKLAGQGRYGEAKELLQSVLKEDFDPDNADARLFAKQIDDPERFEPALTPKHLANVAEVTKLLRLGEGLLTLGDYDKAATQFQSVLLIDPYNSTARRSMERLEQMKTGYFEAARDHTRAKKLSDVSAGWEDIVPPSTDVSRLFGGGSAGTSSIHGSKANLMTRIRSIVFPKVDLQGATLEEVVEYLRIQTRELDSGNKGISFVMRAPPEARSKPITLNLKQVPLEELLRYVTEMSGTAYRLDEFAVNITSLSEKSDALITKSYRVTPDFMASAAMGGAAPDAPIDPFAAKKQGTQSGLISRSRMGAREFLEQRGIAFPAEASASYNPSTNILFVRNTLENITQIDELVEQATGATPKLVEITVRLIEVNSVRMKELGFDWLLGAANVPGSSGAFVSGGTPGNQRSGAFTNNEFPFANPGGSLVGLNPVTSGLRSSGNILGTPSIDNLINNRQQASLDSRSPGQFALAGVFTDPQFQMVIRTLSQSKGVELLASPAVVTKSGQRASIRLVRDFPYPTEYNPPQIPTNIGANAGSAVIPITPAMPTAFKTRPVGIEVEVEPVIGDNNRRVDLSIVPSSVDFEGFINYGEDITLTTTHDLLGNSITVKQPNTILQPIFRTNKVTTSVSVWDGNTIAIGGVISDKRSKIQDKVPIVGDIPLVGRTFQSKVSLVEKKNVVFFVTVRVLDPSGSRLNQAGHTAAAP